MANLFLNQLLHAAGTMERPRFACSLVLAMVSHTDEDGYVHATRDELADLVDRGEYQSRRGQRLARIKSRTGEHRSAMRELRRRLKDGEISQDLYNHEAAELTDKYRKYVRSPTLANVSNVISGFRQLNLMSVSYIDPETGEEFDTTSRGRYARYRFRIPAGHTLMLGDQAHQGDFRRLREEEASRSVKPIRKPSEPRRVKAKRSDHQLSLF